MLSVVPENLVEVMFDRFRKNGIEGHCCCIRIGTALRQPSQSGGCESITQPACCGLVARSASGRDPAASSTELAGHSPKRCFCMAGTVFLKIFVSICQPGTETTNLHIYIDSQSQPKDKIGATNSKERATKSNDETPESSRLHSKEVLTVGTT